MPSEMCNECGAKNAVQKQGPDCIPGFGRRSWNQCSACWHVTRMQKHPYGDKDCMVHRPE